MLAGLMAVLFLLGHVPVRLAQPMSPFDEGIRLASATLTTFGQIPYRDYYVPYGPAGAWIGGAIRALGGGLIAHRVLFTLASAVIVALVVHLAYRRRGLFTALIVGAFLVRYATYDTYVFAYVVLAAAIAVLVGRRADEPGFRGSAQRVLTAGLLLAVAVWFRFELASWLVVWSVLALREHGSKRWLLWPWALGALPYAAIVLSGGLVGLWRTVDYALTDYRVTRARPVPWSAPGDLLGHFTSWGNWDARALDTSFLLTLAYVGVAATVVIAFSVWLVRNHIVPRGRDGHAADRPTDGTGVSVLLWSVLVLSWLSLSARADATHALNLVAPLLLFWSWVQLPRSARPRKGISSSGRVVWVALPALMIATVVLGLTSVPQTLSTYADLRADPSIGPVPSGVLRGTMGEDLSRILPWSRDRGDAPLMVVNTRNDVAYINAPFVLYALDRPTAAWPMAYDPELANTNAVHRAIVDTNCQSPTDVVLWNAPFGPFGGVEDRRSALLDRYIALNHRLELSGGEFDYRVPDREKCLDPEVVSLPDLARVRQRRAAEGDLRAYAYLGEAQVDRGAQLSVRERGDRALAAALAGIPHVAPEDALQERVFRHLALARSGGEIEGSYSIAEGFAGPEVTGVTHLTNALLAAHDRRVGVAPAVSVEAAVQAAIRRDPELAGLVCVTVERAQPAEELRRDLGCPP